MGLSARRRGLMGQESGGESRLPSGYQEVEWVGISTSKGKALAAIDLGIIPTTDTLRVVCDFKPTYTGSKGNLTLGTGDAPYFQLYQASGKLYFRYGSASAVVLLSSYTLDWYSLELGSKMYVDGTLISTKTGDFSSNTQSIKLFSHPSYGDASGRYKEIFVYDDATLVADCVPCYRESDGRKGFYDLIGSEFHTNDGGAVDDLVKRANV